MAVDATMPTTVVSATSSGSASSSSSSSSTASSNTTATLADNFQTFLTLLTTQLQNQNPLDPLDTNQFTQQLVQFASVEQQLKTNDQLSALVSLQKTAQSTQALNFVGATAVVDGTTTAMSSGQAVWRLNFPSAATASISVTNSAGQTVFSDSYQVNSGDQVFAWNGKGNDGTQWPDGNYTISVVAKDSSGQTVAVASEIQGVVSSADLTASPPLLTIGGQQVTLDKIKRVVASGY